MAWHSETFVAHLQTLQARDRGAMAMLRHSLAFAPGDDPRVYPYVERFAGAQSAADDPRRLALYAVAGMFAAHPLPASRSFATAFGELARRRENTSIEKRFVALLEADANAVFTHLRQALSLLDAGELGFNYARLLDDLSQWLAPVDREDALRDVRQRWTRDFYRTLLKERTTETDGGSFVAHLVALAARDRAGLAFLRQSLAFAPGDFPKACPLVEPLIDPDWPIYDARRRARYLVAGLFALNPKVSEKQSLAAALGRMARSRDSDSIEGRFMALLGADADNVADHLRQAVRLIAVEEMAYNPVRLLSDLAIWLNPRTDPAWMDRLRQRWARDFYGAVRRGDESQTPTTENEGV